MSLGRYLMLGIATSFSIGSKFVPPPENFGTASRQKRQRIRKIGRNLFPPRLVPNSLHNNNSDSLTVNSISKLLYTAAYKSAKQHRNCGTMPKRIISKFGGAVLPPVV
jgi:hypothetical protein